MAELGLTPSVAVRALWEQAASRGKEIETIAPLLLGKRERARLLLCLDVWVSLLEKKGGRPEVQPLLGMAKEGGVELLYPAPVIKDVIQAFGGEEGKKSSWKAVERMRAIGSAVGVDEADLAVACRYRPLTTSFDSALALAAAQRAGADYLVTYDQELLRRAPVAALSPGDVCAVLSTRP